MSRKIFSNVSMANCPTREARGILALALIVLIYSYAAPPQVQANDGDLDQSFGAGGKIITDFFGGEDEATATAIQSDGKIIAVGSTSKPFVAASRDFALARYNVDGSLDKSFGSGGKVATDFLGVDDFALAVAIQQDGKIVVGGKHFVPSTNLISSAFAVARYNPDGSLDNSFGSGGKVTGAPGVLDAIAIQNDGKVIAAGFGPFNNCTGFALVRYNADGSLDTSFGVGGQIITGFFDSDIVGPITNARAVIIQPDGKIVAAGSAFDRAAGSFGASLFALARYQRDGSLDTSFGSGGKVTTAILDDSRGMALAIHPDGSMVVAGVAAENVINPADFAGPKFAVARYERDGSLDQSFGSAGMAFSDFFGAKSMMRAVAFQPEGGIVAVGSVRKTSKGSDFAVARYNSDASLDTRFGGSGTVFTEVSTEEDDDANAVAIQLDGQVVAVGATDTGTDFALARYNTELDFALSFNPSTIDAERGTKVPVTLQLARKGGFAGSLTITHSDTSGVRIKGLPDSISTKDDSVSFKLKIKDGAPTGLQQVTFTGKSDSGIERTITLNLMIR